MDRLQILAFFEKEKSYKMGGATSPFVPHFGYNDFPINVCNKLIFFSEDELLQFVLVDNWHFSTELPMENVYFSTSSESKSQKFVTNFFAAEELVAKASSEHVT